MTNFFWILFFVLLLAGNVAITINGMTGFILAAAAAVAAGIIFSFGIMNRTIK